jgi:acyl-CoA thioesterase-1
MTSCIDARRAGVLRRLFARLVAAVLFATALALCLAGTLATSAARADPIRIVAIGDSNFDPPGVDPDVTYPPKLEAALKAKGHDVVVTNAGHRGDQTKDVLHRMDRDVPDGTDIALVTVGPNDRAERVSKETIANNLREIVRRLRERKIEVLLFGIGDLHDPACCFGEALAAATGALYDRNFQDTVFDDPALHVERQRPSPGSALINGSKSATAWHLNPRGYDIVVARTLPQVEELIARVEAKRQ